MCIPKREGEFAFVVHVLREISNKVGNSVLVLKKGYKDCNRVRGVFIFSRSRYSKAR
jgi:hypothetical protein